MHALLAFKRPSTVEGRYQLAFEIRSFGCFNGFNTENAFTTHPTNNSAGRFDVIFDNVLENGALSQSYFWGGIASPGYSGTGERHRPRQELNFDFVTVTGKGDDALLTTAYRDTERPWECIGIGYLCYQVAQCHLQYQAPAVQNPQTGAWVNPQWNGYFQPMASPYGMNGRITALLNRNRIDENYYNHQTGDIMTSRRPDPTPNECFLRNFLHSMRSENIPHEIRYSLKSSRTILAIVYAADYHHLTFDLVGSERPSGLAISYLQVFRNIGEKIWNGMQSTELEKSQYACLVDLSTNWPYATLDPIPLMSYICNNGDDSDIIAFAGRKFVGYATKFGLFNCANLYRRSDSMLIEGKYNKGSQSAHIANTMDDKIAARGEAFIAAFQKVDDTVLALGTYQSHLRKMPNIAGLGLSVQTYTDGLGGSYTNAERENLIIAKAQEYAADVSNWLAANGRQNPKLIINNIRGAASALTSFRTRQSNITLAPNPLGFTQWVRQAEGMGREGATAEGAPTELGGVAPVPAATGNAGTTHRAAAGGLFG